VPIGKESFCSGVHTPRQSADVALLTESSDCATVHLLDIFIYSIFLRHLLIKKAKKKRKEKAAPKKREKKKKKEQEKKESEKNNLEVLASFESLCRALLLLS